MNPLRNFLVGLVSVFFASVSFVGLIYLILHYWVYMLAAYLTMLAICGIWAIGDEICR